MIPLSQFIKDFKADRENYILETMQLEHLDRAAAERRFDVALATCVEAGIVAHDIDPDK